MAFPVVNGRVTNRTTNTNTTSHVITMPAGIVAGELLLVVFTTDGNPTVTAATTGWTKLNQASNSTVVTGAIFYKIATGGDALTLTTSVVEASTHVVLRISNAGAPTATSAIATSTNSNPPLHTPAGGAQDFLWIATRSADSTNVATAAPASFTNLQTIAATGTNGASTNTAEQSLNAASLDPGTFTSATSIGWQSWTISVPPGAAQVRTPVTIASTAAVAAPTVAVTYPAPIASAAAFADPTVVAGPVVLTTALHQNVAVATATLPSAALTPSATRTPSLGGDAQDVVYPPTSVSIGVTSLSPTSVESTAAVLAPILTLAVAVVAPAAVAATESVFAPTLAVSYPETVTPTGVVFEPTLGVLGQTRFPATVGNVTGPLTPSVALTASATRLPSTGGQPVLDAVHLPQLGVLQQHQPQLIASTATVATPRVAVTISVAVVRERALPQRPSTQLPPSTALLPSLSTPVADDIRAPGVVAGGITITPQPVDVVQATAGLYPGGSLYPADTLYSAGQQVSSPTVVVLVALAPIAQTSVVQIPTLTVGPANLSPEQIPSGADVQRPIAAQISQPVTITSTAVVAAPAVTTTSPIVRPELLVTVAVFPPPTVVYGPASAAPEVLASTATVGQPTVVVALQIARIEPSSTAGQPLVGVDVTVEPQLLASTAVLGAVAVTAGPITAHPATHAAFARVDPPTVVIATINLAPTTIPATSTLHAPTLQRGTLVVAPAMIGPDSTIAVPAMAVVFPIALDRIGPTSTVAAPTVSISELSVEIEFIDTEEDVQDPFVLTGQALVRTTLIASTEAVHAPASVAYGPATFQPALLVSISTVATPAVATALTRSVVRVDNTAVVEDPSVLLGEVTRTVTSIGSTAAVAAPTVQTAVTLQVAPIASPEQVFALDSATIGAAAVRPELVASTATLFAPAVTTGRVVVGPAPLASTAAVFTPVVAGGPGVVQALAPLVIASTAVVGLPSWFRGGPTLIEVITSTGRVFRPVVRGGQAPPRPPKVRAGSPVDLVDGPYPGLPTATGAVVRAGRPVTTAGPRAGAPVPA